jgi:hypothetical protein
VPEALINASWRSKQARGLSGAIQRQTNLQVLYALFRLAFNPAADNDVRAISLAAISTLDTWLSRQSPKSDVLNAHFRFAQFEIDRLLGDPAEIGVLIPVTVPPGGPIGSYQTSIH